MKSLFKQLALLFFAGLAFSACQKEFTIGEGPDPVDPPLNPADSNYLDKIIYTYYDAGITEDSGIGFFAYDNQKRVVSFIDSGFLSGVHSKQVFTYNASDTLPVFYLNVRYDTPGNPDSTKKYLTYDAMGKKLRDSTLTYVYDGSIPGYEVSLQVNNYSYAPGKIYQEEYFSYSNNGIYDMVRRDTAVVAPSGDILSNKKYVLNDATSTFDLFEVSTFSLDGRINPFSKLSSFKSLPVFPAGDDYYHGFFQQYNNVTRISNAYTGPPSTVTNIDFNFVYNTAGLPTKSVNFWPDSDSLKLEYKYKNL